MAAQTHPDPESFAETLMGFPLFEGYTIHGIKRLIEAGSILRGEPGDVIFREGDPPDAVVLGLNGNIDIVTLVSGGEKVIASLAPGHLVGEIALICEMPRSATARLRDATDYLCWDARSFRRLMHGDAGFARRVFRQSMRAVITTERELLSGRETGA